MRVPAYAAFLACSWTWCIGLYLPVLLLRDLGIWSFAPFALANCAGAAAFGVMLWRPGASQRLLAEHLPATRVFSLATIAFQAWFLWHVLTVSGTAWTITTWGGVMGAVLGVLAARPRFSLRAFGSVAAYVVSLALIGWWLAQAEWPKECSLPTVGEKWADLLALTPVCLLGFLLCPYLDFTFHAARQSLPGRPGTWAFLVGFLVLFPLMIAAAVLYGIAGTAMDAAEPLRAMHPFILVHMAMQLTFTIAVHHACVAGSAATRRRGIVESIVALMVVPGALAAIETWLAPDHFGRAGLAFSEVVYRACIGLYGLVFPAYVLLCVVGGEGVRPTPDRRTLVLFGAAVILASPAYYFGFIEGRMPWLLAGVLIVLLVKGMIRPVGVHAAP